jgi:hypothetical protein
VTDFSTIDAEINTERAEIDELWGLVAYLAKGVTTYDDVRPDVLARLIANEPHATADATRAEMALATCVSTARIHRQLTLASTAHTVHRLLEPWATTTVEAAPPAVRTEAQHHLDILTTDPTFPRA